MITIYDNFFSKNVLHAIIDRSKSTQLYTFEEHREHTENYMIGNWYGKRSYNLIDEDQLLNALILDELLFRHFFMVTYKLPIAICFCKPTLWKCQALRSLPWLMQEQSRPK